MASLRNVISEYMKSTGVYEYLKTQGMEDLLEGIAQRNAECIGAQMEAVELATRRCEAKLERK